MQLPQQCRPDATALEQSLQQSVVHVVTQQAQMCHSPKAKSLLAGMHPGVHSQKTAEGDCLQALQLRL